MKNTQFCGQKHFAVPVARVVTGTRDDGQALVVTE